MPFTILEIINIKGKSMRKIENRNTKNKIPRKIMIGIMIKQMK